MASKFMAFEGVAATSSSTWNEFCENERIEMNAAQYPNYQSNQSSSTIEQSPYAAVDGEENDLNDENIEEKCDRSVGYRKFIHRNSEQFKSICGGLLLLMGCGIHIVWGIFRVFNWYRCNEESSFYLRFVIWSWYIGAIIGNCTAGYVVTKLRKRHIYFTGGVLLLVSGMFIALSDADTNICLLISRIVGGFVQGLTYVVVIVHASENATKEFREFLMLIVGAVMNYSILISVLAFFHTEHLFSLSLLNGMSLFAFGLITMIVVSKHATETIPFILQNNGSEMDALQTMSKLKKKPVAARSVHHDFLTLKNLVQDEMDHYGMPAFHKILLPENRKSLIFCCYGRLCSVLSFNLPLIVMIMLFLRGWVDESAIEHGVTVPDYCRVGDVPKELAFTESPYTEPDEIEIKADAVRERYRRHTGEKSEEDKMLEEKQKEIDRMEKSDAGSSKKKGTESKNGEGNERNFDENRKNDEENVKNKGAEHGEKTEPESTAKKTESKAYGNSRKSDEVEKSNEIDKNSRKMKNEREKSEEREKNEEHEKEHRGKNEENRGRNEHERTEEGEREREKDKEGEREREKDREEKGHRKGEEEHRGKNEREHEGSKEREREREKEREKERKESREGNEKERQRAEERDKERKGQREKGEENREKNEKEKSKVNEKEKAKDRKGNHKENAEKSDKESSIKSKDEKSKNESITEQNGTPSPKLVGLTFVGHLITFLHSRELTLILLAWFLFGTLTAAILYTLNLRRFIYHAACVLSSVLAIAGLAHSFHLFSSILHFCLIVYFNYVTIPIDLFGHCMLAEAFPITLKAFSIAGVAIVEHTVHIIIIALYMTEWFHDSIILFMCIVAFVSHEIARNLPQQTDLTLGEAREQYQHIDLMLFNEPKIVNQQQQDFI